MPSTMNRPHEELRPDQSPRIAELLTLELPRVRAFVERLTRETHPVVEPEDIVQETAERALRYHASFDAKRPLGPWLFKMALRLVLDRRADLRRDEAHRADFARVAGGASPADSSAGLDQETLECWMADLSVVERDVLLRFHQRGESLREISQALRVPEGTLKSHLHRARKKLARRET
jgi:RNA polymerase sigma-70 factor (ECF subfamily)